MKRQEFARIFYREAARFARHSPKCERVRVSIETAPTVLPGANAYRDLAYALIDRRPPLIVVHKRLLAMPLDNVLGVVRHELGHIADPTPHAKDWEQRADDVAEYVTGAKIRYDEFDIQTVGPGSYPRPRHLHK